MPIKIDYYVHLQSYRTSNEFCISLFFQQFIIYLPGVRSNLSIWSPSMEAQLCNWSRIPHGVVMATVRMTSVCGNVSSQRANFSRFECPGSPSRTHTLSRVWSVIEFAIILCSLLANKNNHNRISKLGRWTDMVGYYSTIKSLKPKKKNRLRTINNFLRINSSRIWTLMSWLQVLRWLGSV